MSNLATKNGWLVTVHNIKTTLRKLRIKQSSQLRYDMIYSRPELYLAPRTSYLKTNMPVNDGELQDTQSDQNDTKTSEPVSSGPFKWFVLVTFIIFSSSLAMAQMIFVPIPKQAAAYYGIKGKYSEILSRGLIPGFLRSRKVFPIKKSC